jgi:hypothetical protein
MHWLDGACLVGCPPALQKPSLSAAVLGPSELRRRNRKEKTTCHPHAACRRLHVALCAGQSAFWHDFPQYRTVRHRLHSFSLPSSAPFAVMAQCAHAQAAERAGVACTRGNPLGEVGSGAPEDCPWPGMYEKLVHGKPSPSLVGRRNTCTRHVRQPSGHGSAQPPDNQARHMSVFNTRRHARRMVKLTGSDQDPLIVG